MKAQIAIITIGLGTACVVSGQTIAVGPHRDVFSAGSSSVPASHDGGTLAVLAATFLAGPGNAFTFCATGSVSIGAVPTNGPDGGLSLAPTDVFSDGGIAGLKSDRTMFLAGVFLDESAPTSTPPVRLDFSSAGFGTAFPNLTPQIGQTFFIGDGFVGIGTGTLQHFYAPPTATRLFLGFADAWDGYSIRGHPGAYGDNIGSLSVTITQEANCPPASSVALRFYAGITILAPVGTTQRIDYVTDLANPNWTALTNVLITRWPFIYFDPDSLLGSRRFYRTVQLP
jgi:hypothetical protein